MERKIRYSDYDIIGKNFENTVEHPLHFFLIYRNLQDIEVGLICKLHNDA